MKTKNRLLTIVLCLLVIAFGLLGLSACGGEAACSHQWGEWSVTKNATCTESGSQERVCTKCGMKEMSSIATAEHTPSADDGDCMTAVTCSVCGTVTTPASDGHTGGKATCMSKAVCDVCGKKYGSFESHTPNDDDGDCTTAVTCSVCGVLTSPASAGHKGGTANCTNRAKCEVCGTEYGSLSSHIPSEDDGDCTTPINCSICDVTMTPGKAVHTGGTATCENKAKCTVCNKEYGELLMHTPHADDGDCTTPIACSACGTITAEAKAHIFDNDCDASCNNNGCEHTRAAAHTPHDDDGDCTTAVNCSVCGTVVTPGNAMHTGGTATCTNRAECSVCGTEYGSLAEHIPYADDGDCTTAVSCSVCGTVAIPGNAAHTGGTADCTNRARCELCGKEYGELSTHTPHADDGDCTTALGCSACGVVITPANEAHTGGTATCTSRAECSVCGKEYGELLTHGNTTICIKHIDSHYFVYTCCYEKASEPEEHNIVDGACTVCGYNPTITATSTEVSPGDKQVTVTLSLRDNPGIVGLFMTVQYSSDMFTLTDARSGEALDALMFTAPSALGSGCTFMWDGVEIQDKDIKDGEILVLTFDVADNAPTGEYSILFNISAFDNDLNRVNLRVVGGKVTISNN